VAATDFLDLAPGAAPAAYLTTTLGLARDVVDEGVLARTAERSRALGIQLPTFAQLRSPSTIPAATLAALAGVDRMAPDPRNLFRVHWYNEVDGRCPASRFR
jgi:hypothetical protein